MWGGAWHNVKHPWHTHSHTQPHTATTQRTTDAPWQSRPSTLCSWPRCTHVGAAAHTVQWPTHTPHHNAREQATPCAYNSQQHQQPPHTHTQPPHTSSSCFNCAFSASWARDLDTASFVCSPCRCASSCAVAAMGSNCWTALRRFSCVTGAESNSARVGSWNKTYLWRTMRQVRCHARDSEGGCHDESIGVDYRTVGNEAGHRRGSQTCSGRPNSPAVTDGARPSARQGCYQPGAALSATP